MDSSNVRDAIRDACGALSGDELDRLIENWLEINPAKPSRDEVWTKPGGVPVWAIVSNLEIHSNDIEELARVFDLPVDAVRAALAYYRRNAPVIDARIEANTGEFSSLID